MDVTDAVDLRGPGSLLERLAALAAAVSLEDLGREVVDDAELVLFHNLVVALAARRTDVPGLDRTPWPRGMPPARSARRLPDLVRSPLDAAVLNGSLLMGARAQHDEYPPATSHFGSTVIPPLLALSDAVTVSGKRFLEAMVAGYEAGARVGAATVGPTRARGFRPTGIYGPIASATACAVALGLPSPRIVSSMALGAHQAAGLMQVWLEGTDEWRFHTAFAARNGLTAALLAADGVRGAASSLEGPAGYLRAYADDAGIAVDTDRPDGAWAISDVLLKAYPVCALNQAAMQQLLDLCRREGLGARDIAQVRVTLEQQDVDYPGVGAAGAPRTASAALMSLPYCAARAVVDGELSLPAGWDLDAPEPLRFMERVVLEPHRDPAPSRRGRHGASVEVVLTDGRRLGGTDPQLLRYDRSTAQGLATSLLPAVGIGRDRIEAIAELVFGLERCPDVSELTGLLTSGTEGP
ncbi:MmgE/PrpD family protein [Kocuria sp. M1R5S2]|uniref:MmgE/PrpD family protein n=1 Tax=Kocuria rhizosphaerae TaxID=3376285 RepID=UPI00379BE6C4